MDTLWKKESNRAQYIDLFASYHETELVEKVMKEITNMNTDQFIKLMDTVRRVPDYEPTLDYEPNKYFPCLANVVDMECNSDFGRHLVANSDIPYGKVILVEKSFAMGRMDDFSVCYTCYQSYVNSIACKQCEKVVFCCLECMNQNQTHALECGTIFGQIFFPNDVEAQFGVNRIKLIIQTVLNAISIFPSVAHLMQFIENTLREDPDHLPKSLHNQLTKYHFFFKLKKRMQYELKETLDDVNLLFKITMSLPKVRALFDREEKQRFLLHLITHHSFVIGTNAIASARVYAIYNMFSIFNHACEPNIIPCDSDKLIGGKTNRLIKKGEQLFISYLSPSEAKLPKKDRQNILQSGWGFDCECMKCISTDSPINTQINNVTKNMFANYI